MQVLRLYVMRYVFLQLTQLTNASKKEIEGCDFGVLSMY
jgi:hypothetical protein